MTYATQTDLEDAFGATEILQLADRDQDEVIDAGVIEAALARADSVIDGYLGGRYALPLATPFPPVIVATACDLARYWLHDDAATERVREGFEDAMAWLKDVAVGKVLLQLLAASANVAVGSPDGSAPDRTFDLSGETLLSQF
jgi:phage gp36-like protein